MPSTETNHVIVTRQQEKPHHYNYLKSFRTEQCKEFLQHRCTQHRPYTCFHWHFPNQKRRRPVLNSKDGTFNYSPDQYCTKYDESIGSCSDGDSCPYLHRNIGDTEKRYHLRYFKTEMCAGEMDSRGNCSKNGPHCAFAHGTDDLRLPVCDAVEMQGARINGDSHTNCFDNLVDKEPKAVLHIDNCWNDVKYMLNHYKTEQCKVTVPRHLAISCPHYHGQKDRRRSINLYKYRAVPCPMVRNKDDWGEPSLCDAGDSCTYSHTRTEQQYHPDVFRTVSCQEELNNGFCPKGIFCAFAHENNSIYLANSTQNEPAKMVNETNGSNSTRSATGKKLDSAMSSGSSITSGQLGINNLPTTVGSCPNLESSWLGFSSIKLDSGPSDNEMHSVLMAKPAAGLGLFSDSGSLWAFNSQPTTALPLYSSINPPCSSVVTPIMATFQASRTIDNVIGPTGNSNCLLDRLDSMNEDKDHSLLKSPPKFNPKSNTFNGNDINYGIPHPHARMPDANDRCHQLQKELIEARKFASSLLEEKHIAIKERNEVTETLVDCLLDFNDPLDSSIQADIMNPDREFFSVDFFYFYNFMVCFKLSSKDELTWFINSEQSNILMMRKWIGDFQILEDKNELALMQLDLARREKLAPDDRKFFRCLHPDVELEKLSVSLLEQIQSQLQLDLRRVQMVLSRVANAKCLLCQIRNASVTLSCKHKFCQACFSTNMNCPFCMAAMHGLPNLPM